MSDDLIILSKEEQITLNRIEDLNKPRGDGIEAGLKTRLHKGQIDALSYFYKKSYSLIIQPCGRKFGKSEEAIYYLWKSALENPGSANYYVTPEGSHGRKIVWDTWRIQRFLGKDSEKYTNQARSQVMLVPFKNGSFIQVIGSENFGSANGLTPDAAVYDEFKLFHPRFHTDFAPNLIAKAAPLLIIGTIPTPGDRNYEQYFDVMEACKKDPRAIVITKTTFDNPINHMPAQKKAIEDEIARLRARGEEDVVQREYYSRIVSGGKRSIFPMFNRERHSSHLDTMLEEVGKDVKKMEWFCITDPGSTTCFAALIGCVHPYTRKIYILDEIYEKDQHNTSTRRIYPKLADKMHEFYPMSSIEDDWVKIFDEAAAWFSTEVMSQYGVYFMPTAKHMNKKEHGLSLIKDLLLHDLVVISHRCQNLMEEMETYAKDIKGNIPKRNDHAIDCFRYLLGAAHYNMVETLEAKIKENEWEKGRKRRIEDDPWLQDRDEDWTDGFSDF